jgi:Photosynthesis system II assembly factor YCF48
VHFADARTGWAVGEGGTIVVTRDGGANWAPQHSGTEKYLQGVHFADARLGWAAGEGGTILATHDAGASWARQRSGTEYLRGVHFADTRLGWAVGEGGTILATHDGGASWARQRSGTDKFLWGVHFADARLGWAVGGSGTIVATRDGGASWAPQRIGRSVDATSCSPIITNTEGNITITSNCLVTPEEIAQIMQARGGLSNRSFSGIGAWFNAQPEWLKSLLVLAGLSLLWCGFLFALWGIAPQKLVALHEWLPDPKALDQAAEVTDKLTAGLSKALRLSSIAISNHRIPRTVLCHFWQAHSER